MKKDIKENDSQISFKTSEEVNLVIPKKGITKENKKFVSLEMLEEAKFDDGGLLSQNYNFIVIDIETTGLSPYAEKLTEIVALKYSGQWDLFYPVYHNLINPGKKIPDFITKLTGITDEMVKYKPFGIQAVKELTRNLNTSSDILVAHNAKFEFDWLTFYEPGLKICNWICTRAIYLYMRDGDLWKNFYTKNYSKLENVCNFYGIEYKQEDAHRAEYDVLKTQLVAKEMIKKIGLKKCIQVSEEFIAEIGKERKPKYKTQKIISKDKKDKGGIYGK